MKRNVNTTPQRGPEAVRCPLPHGQERPVTKYQLWKWRKRKELPLEYRPWPWVVTVEGNTTTATLYQPIRAETRKRAKFCAS